MIRVFIKQLWFDTKEEKDKSPHIHTYNEVFEQFFC